MAETSVLDLSIYLTATFDSRFTSFEPYKEIDGMIYASKKLKIEFNGRQHHVEVSNNTTLSDLTMKLSNLIPKGNQRLKFNALVLEGGKTLQSYQFGSDITVLFRQMYVITVQEFGLPHQKCGLVVHKDNTIGDINHGATLGYYDINHGTNLTMKINIHFEGVNHEFTVKDGAAVFDLKVQVQKKLGFLVTNQRLFIDGSTMLNDYNTLLGYGIVDDTTLSLRYKILVHVQPNRCGISKEYEIFVHDYNTVANLKQMLNFEYGIDIRSIKLKTGNSNLEDSRKIWDSDIKPGCRLHMI
ncbi:hypothetical protein SADUNF_Sadunf04G0012500 [Salix dunnii]|uniref:Ubiquitin-like domain-containing protein n=1 Tax=Salix dunnii TaxID=1413687 RepID=A0A835K9W6_9ROSI|nr:hypothetical protein SADUNF_Sadunf04G0012500 [Salix dunnii]